MGSRAHTFLLQLQVDWNIVLRKITIAHPLGEIVRADHLLASFLEARLRALSRLVAALQEKNANGLKRGESVARFRSIRTLFYDCPHALRMDRSASRSSVRTKRQIVFRSTRPNDSISESFSDGGRKNESK